MNFPEKIKQLRKEKGLTQNDLAKQLGISRSSVAGYETSVSMPDIDRIVELAKFFNISADYLLGKTDNPTPYDDSFEKSDDELRDFLEDKEITAMFKDYGSWTDEEKQAILAVLKGQKALRESKK